MTAVTTAGTLLKRARAARVTHDRLARQAADEQNRQTIQRLREAANRALAHVLGTDTDEFGQAPPVAAWDVHLGSADLPKPTYAIATVDGLTFRYDGGDAPPLSVAVRCERCGTTVWRTFGALHGIAVAVDGPSRCDVCFNKAHPTPASPASMPAGELIERAGGHLTKAVEHVDADDAGTQALIAVGHLLMVVSKRR